MVDSKSIVETDQPGESTALATRIELDAALRFLETETEFSLSKEIGPELREINVALIKVPHAQGALRSAIVALAVSTAVSLVPLRIANQTVPSQWLSSVVLLVAFACIAFASAFLAYRDSRT